MSWSKRLADPATGGFEDWKNPFNFYGLLITLDDRSLCSWLKEHNLLAKSLNCETCTRRCKEVRSSSKKGGMIWRCRGSVTWPHSSSYSSSHNSIFQGSHFDFREVLVFIREWILSSSLHRCAVTAGMDYKKTSVDWSNYMRDICCKFVDELYYGDNPEKFSGEVEIDESLFGRRCKYHRGDPRGVKVWIFGIIERSSNRIILYPVDERNEATLIPLIERHVSPGSTIFSDGWRAYHSLNQRGYQHFTVEHKQRFKQLYKNEETGQLKEVHTNTIEGSWKIAKDHFRHINGTRLSNFEGHLCEVIWRNRVTSQKSDRITHFFSLLQKYYTLTRRPSLQVRYPVFDSWNAHQDEDRIHRDEVDAGVDETIPPQPTTEQPRPTQPPQSEIPSTSSTSKQPTPPPGSPSHSIPHVPKRHILSPGRKSSLSSTVKSKKVRRDRGTLVHPAGFVPVDTKGKSITKKERPGYRKVDFVFDFSSSDSDFQ